ncbi:MAG: rhomboid family intramembrane serine protease [Candidatus Woesearchaeota archaeon]
MIKQYSVVSTLVIITVCIFILQLVVPPLTGMFALQSNQLLMQPYRIVTYMFLHASFFHILFNMYALYLFGSLLQQSIGAKRLITVYFATGIGAAILYMLPAVLTGQQVNAVGASGAVFGVIGALMVIMPRLPLLFFFVVPMPLWVAGIMFFLIDVIGMAGNTNVAHLAHIIGMLMGLGFGWYYKKKAKQFHKRFSRTFELDDTDLDDYLRNGRL